MDFEYKPGSDDLKDVSWSGDVTRTVWMDPDSQLGFLPGMKPTWSLDMFDKPFFKYKLYS